MIAVYIILAVILINILLYLLVFVRPKTKAPTDPRLFCSYAHRGLHGDGIPENSLAAFKKAIDHGYGIELDVQLSLDGAVMVFHDYTLTRMTGVDKKLCELTSSEITNLFLLDSDQNIPTLRQVLNRIDGKVPILIELKGETFNSDLCPKVAEILKDYKGPYCIESFNPLLIKAMQRYLPDAFYGQLYTNVCRDKKKYSLLNILLTAMAFNFLAKPNFIAYNKLDRKSLPVKLTTKLYKAPKFVWTLKGQTEMANAKSLGECPIFEIK